MTANVKVDSEMFQGIDIAAISRALADIIQVRLLEASNALCNRTDDVNIIAEDDNTPNDAAIRIARRDRC